MWPGIAKIPAMSHDPAPKRTRALAGLNPSALVRLGMAERTEGPPEVPGYEILESLGRGGMGEVFRARQESLGRAVAVKILRADLPATGWLPERFEQEARTMAALQHPNVVTVHDCVRLHDGRVAIVMELISGGSLRARLSDAPEGLPLALALRWAREIAEGLRTAHGAGLVHRDVKPDNILIDDAGTARVSDFGLSFSGDLSRTRYTQTGAAAGTPGYMPPEIWNRGVADVRSDVFSYGAMLYEMFTGRLPQGSFPPPRMLRADIPPALSETIVAALRPDPAHRPADMGAMLRALTPGGTRFTRRRVIATVSAGTAAGVAAGAVHWWNHRDEKVPDKSIAAPPAPEPAGPWTKIPWPTVPAPLAISGGWSLEKSGVLISNSQICILPISGIPPRPCRMRLRFRRLEGELSIGIFFRTAMGTAVCTLDGRGRHLGGVQMVDGLTLEQSGGFFLPLENGREYEFTVEIRPEQVRMWVDGTLRDERNIDNRPLGVPDTWNWVPGPRTAAVHIGSWESPTEFYSLEWLPLP
jgi:serine/threonine protein kinase